MSSFDRSQLVTIAANLIRGSTNSSSDFAWDGFHMEEFFAQDSHFVELGICLDGFGMVLGWRETATFSTWNNGSQAIGSSPFLPFF